MYLHFVQKLSISTVECFRLTDLVTNWMQVWITQGDIILLGLRDYQDAKADVIMKYTAEVRTGGSRIASVRGRDDFCRLGAGASRGHWY